MLKLGDQSAIPQPFIKKSVKTEQSEEIKKIINELNRAKSELEIANQNFEFATEPLLIDMYAYQIKAAQAKYSYMMGIVRKMEIEQKAYLEDTFFSKVVY